MNLPAPRKISDAAVLLALLFFAFAAQAVAANYYVDYSAGSDLNVGTSQTSAWKHCPGDPAATGNSATATLVAGDRVTFKGGVSYVLTGATGIQLRWSGTATAAITYDGNSAGTWGTGRARLTDNNGAKGIAAFWANLPVSNLAFRSFEFAEIGGSAALPADSGSPVAPRYGAGISFGGGVTAATIDDCQFHDLGYWYTAKPMGAASISGSGVHASSCNNLRITNCDFYQVASGIDLFRASAVTDLSVSGCTFHDAVCWPIDLPPPTVPLTNYQSYGCVETNNAQFATGWSGYGHSPRTDVQTATAGSPVKFTVSSTATPAASYQWRKNGVALAGATAATYSIASVTAADAGTYTVLATNSAGSTASNDAILSVVSTGTAPSFTSQPVSKSVVEQASVSFTAAATGTPAPSLQWYKNGTALQGATSGTLTIAAASATDAGNYHVVATNTAGSATSTVAVLTVSASTVAPSITTQPVSQTVDTLAKVTFTVAATGTPAPTYQWKKNGTLISGATASSYVIAAASTTDAGTYTAVATNSAGSVTSTGATLTVRAPATAPQITTQPTSQTVTASSSVTFSIAATGSPAPTYQWRKNGTAILGATGSSYTIASVTTSDAGQYSATATNSAGTATSTTATLTVNTPVVVSQDQVPSFTLHPVSQSISTRATVSLKVAASGSPAPTYQWYKNGVAVSGATNATFTVVNLKRGSYQYHAVARNRAGAARSNTATITVGSSTSSTAKAMTNTTVLSYGDLSVTNPESVQCELGGKATLSVTASSSTPVFYQWFKNDEAIEGATTATLELDGIAADDAGLYSVAVNDSNAEITSDPAVLTVNSASSRLSNLSVRAGAGSGTKTMIVGFVLAGSDEETLLIRGVGPSLEKLGVKNFLRDPQLSLYSGQNRIALNSDWKSSTDAAQVATLGRGLGAFDLSDTLSDAALLPNLSPGVYTAQVTSASTSTGEALIELYDSSPATGGRLVNVSVRANVGTGTQVPIVGFVVTGDAPKRLLIRAVGPSLAQLGVDGTLADPRLEIFKGTTLITGNDNWAGDAALSEAFKQVGAFDLANGNSTDAAIIFTAEPGAYTAIVSGVGDTTGVAIVEVYEMP